MTFFAGLALMLAVGCRGGRSRRRLPGRARSRGGRARRAPRPVLLAGAGLGLTGLFTAAPRVTVVACLGAALLVLRRARARPAGEVGDVAATLDVLAACLDAGATPAAAAHAAAGASAGTVAATLVQVASRLQCGEDPDDVWRRASAACPALGPAARACGRTYLSGAAVADELRRVAATARADTVARRRRRVQRASVWLVLPLGGCFLPAFVLVGVAPIVISAVPRLTR